MSPDFYLSVPTIGEIAKGITLLAAGKKKKKAARKETVTAAPL
jgi:hypothetical protein